MSIATLEGSLHRGCGGRYTLETETVTVRLSGMAAEVDRQYFRCDKCGHDNRTIDQREAAEKVAIERIRTTNNLLTPRGIKQLRESLGITIPQFSELCYGTPKGIVEGWEKGRYLQNREADALMRGLTDRATLEKRAAKAGVTLPVLEPVGGGPNEPNTVQPDAVQPIAMKSAPDVKADSPPD
ncbi:MAG: hypothetical protein ABI852_02515 [Gemmatimonadaceae bacterium]